MGGLDELGKEKRILSKVFSILLQAILKLILICKILLKIKYFNSCYIFDIYAEQSQYY